MVVAKCAGRGLLRERSAGDRLFGTSQRVWPVAAAVEAVYFISHMTPDSLSKFVSNG